MWFINVCCNVRDHDKSIFNLIMQSKKKKKKKVEKLWNQRVLTILCDTNLMGLKSKSIFSKDFISVILIILYVTTLC
jgi:hypothetical protein